MINLRERFVQALGKMLTSANSESADDFIDQWKVLIYDQDCRDIISPLMNVGALRQKGVTLHMMLQSEREVISDAPSVYFVRPTEANIRRIADDCSKALYRSVSLNFVTRIDRILMEKLAQELVASNSHALISKIYDQYLDFTVLEPSLFSLNIQDSFIAYNDPSLSETQIRGFMSRCSMGLASLIRVAGVLPIIRAPTAGAAEMLAQELCNNMREQLSPRGPAPALFADCLLSDRPRPLLLIFDRCGDLAPPLAHNSVYQALIDDLLDHRLNRVTVEVQSKDGTPPKKRTYDLNSHSDGFLQRHAGAPFPEAVEANEVELAEVSKRESELRSHPKSAETDMSLSGIGAGGEQSGKKDLTEAIESLPEILNRKANLEAHTNILQALMKQIAAREVPTYFEIEQNIISTGRVDKAAALALLKDGTKGQLQDKARLLAIVAASGDSSISKLAEEFDTAFSQGCASLASPPSQEQIDQALAGAAFIRRLQALQTPISQRIVSTSAAGAGQSLTSFLTNAQSRATSLITKAASFFTKFSPLYVTRVADNLAEGKPCSEDDSFCTLDPRLKPGDIPDVRGQKYSEVIVFVLGGGCYTEYFNLQELLKLKATSGGVLRNVTYGCSELVSGDDFIAQLQRLGAPSSK